MPLLLGVDVGTSSTKALLVDENGRTFGLGRFAYATSNPQPGWVEQDPACWLEGFKASVRQAIESSGRAWSEICALSITHQRYTIVPVDARMEPLCPAIVWSDTRSSEELDWATRTIGARHIFRRTGCAPGLWSVYKALWLKRHRPDIYRKTHKILMVPDLLIYKLTQKLATTESSAATSGMLDICSKNQWETDLLAEFGLDKNLFVERICPAGQVMGTVTRDAEARFGVPAGIPVISAAGDQPCGSLGAGQFEPGSASINGGTSLTSELLCSTLPELEHENYFVEISPTGEYLLESAVYTGGSALMNWYRSNLDVSNETEGAEKRQGQWNTIYKLPEKAPEGNLGLLLIPFLGGAGPPYWNLDARGALLGLSTDHHREHIVRAIIEGLAYESRRELELMEEDIDTPVTWLINYGGSSRSPVWNQTFADIHNRPLSASANSETTALGAAVCAAAGLGIHSGVVSAAKIMTGDALTYQPRPAQAALHDRIYREIYCGIYDSLVDKLSLARRISLESAAGTGIT